MIYGSWNIRCDRQEFLTLWATFCPFSPLTTWKIKILTLKKNTWSYYHFTHLHHKWQSYMYGSWDMECNRHSFLSFWTIFGHFTPLWTKKIKTFKNIEKQLKVLSFYKHKWQFLRYRVQWTEFSSFWTIFLPFYPPNNPKNQNF